MAPILTAAQLLQIDHIGLHLEKFSIKYKN